MNDWKGQTVVILASGPSLTPQQCEIAQKWHVSGGGKAIVINTTWESAPWADALYGCAVWWKYNIDKVRKGFAGQLWTEGEAPAKQYGLNRIESRNGVGLSNDPGFVFRGGGNKGAGNSGYQAINLAYHWGVKRIVLLGFDMHKSEDGRKNHHRPHPLSIDSPYQHWVPNFTPLAADLRAAGIEVLNATPGSSLRCFSMIELAEVLRARPMLAA